METMARWRNCWRKSYPHYDGTGRNETPADGPTLVAGHRAYRDNHGSMKALLLSLLTPDAFLYRAKTE